MGYTHYWTRPVEIDQQRFDRLSEACGEVIESLRRPDMQLRDVQHDSERVWFNGNVETFAFPRVEERPTWVSDLGVAEDKVMGFCKTRLAPYDVLVVECLRAIRRVLGDDIELSSDGEGVFDE